MTIESLGRQLVIDAGSGITMLEDELRADDPLRQLAKRDFTFLISHLHLDHIIGFGTFSAIWKNPSDIQIFTCSRDSRETLKQQVFGVFKPPYWPDTLAETSGASCIEIESRLPFRVNHFTVTPFLAKHPNQTLSFHVTDGKRTMVHLLDSELAALNSARYGELCEFCAGADLVVFDAAYSGADYPRHRGWGHSTVEQGVSLARECRPKRMMFAHYSQHYSDDELDSWTEHFENESGTEYIMARDGIELEL